MTGTLIAIDRDPERRAPCCESVGDGPGVARTVDDLDALTLPQRSLSSFWPRRGPQWDGLARTGRGDLLLVEAKAHVADGR